MKKLWYVWIIWEHIGNNNYIQYCRNRQNAEVVLDQLLNELKNKIEYPFSHFASIDFIWYSDIQIPTEKLHGEKWLVVDDVLNVI